MELAEATAALVALLSLSFIPSLGLKSFDEVSLITLSWAFLLEPTLQKQKQVIKNRKLGA